MPTDTTIEVLNRIRVMRLDLLRCASLLSRDDPDSKAAEAARKAAVQLDAMRQHLQDSELEVMA